MTFEADEHVARLALRRSELTRVKDDGEFQTVEAMGYADEAFRNVHRVQPFGLSANPPAGSHALIAAVNGRPDQAVMLGAEAPTHRPRNLPSGATKLYDSADGFVYLDAAGNLFAEVTKGARVKAGEAVTIEAPTITIKGNVVVEGNITQTGGITSTGVHKAAGHT